VTTEGDGGRAEGDVAARGVQGVLEAHFAAGRPHGHWLVRAAVAVEGGHAEAEVAVAALHNKH
jgi:hypothetical protein